VAGNLIEATVTGTTENTNNDFGVTASSADVTVTIIPAEVADQTQWTLSNDTFGITTPLRNSGDTLIELIPADWELEGTALQHWTTPSKTVTLVHGDNNFELEYIPVDLDVIVTIDPIGTADSTPLLTGTVDHPLATVTLAFADRQYDVTDIDTDAGTWQFQITDPIPDGTYDAVVSGTIYSVPPFTDTSADEIVIGAGPLILDAVDDVIVDQNAGNTVISLTDRYSDPTLDLVRFNFVIPDKADLANPVNLPVEVKLFRAETPLSVENFLSYQTDYAGSIIHRWSPGFVIQGGGFTFDRAPDVVNPAGADFYPAVPQKDYLKNEPGIENTRGTIAMAKLGVSPDGGTTASEDSATNQWFFNLADNRSNLDNQNGGFTVFGEVVSGMEHIDAIAGGNDKIRQWNASSIRSAFGELPLSEYANDGFLPDERDLIMLTNVEVLDDITLSVLNSNPDLVTATLAGETLTLSYAANTTGAALVTVRATAVDGRFTDDVFLVAVGTGIAGTVYDDTDANGVITTADTPLGGVDVFIDANDNGTLDDGERSTVSAGDGTYLLDGLGDGDYLLRTSPSDSQSQTFPIGARQVTLGGAAFVDSVNFAVAEHRGSISGTVTADAGPLDGVVVFLDLDSSGDLSAGDTTKVTVGGTYAFSNLTAGNYTVRQVLPATGMTQTAPAGDAGIDVVLAAGQNSDANDFTNSGQPASIGGTLSDNSNGDVGLEGATVELWTNDLLYGSTLTGADGTYLFDDLRPGAYVVRFDELLPPLSGYDPSTDVNGAVEVGTGQAADVSSGFTALAASNLDVTVKKGWQLLSLPKRPLDPRLSGMPLDAQRVVHTVLSSSGGNTPQLVRTSRLEALEGYWVYATEELTFQLQVVGVDGKRQIGTGWSLVGPADSIPLPTDDDIVSDFWCFDVAKGRFIPSDTLEPGNGYWIKTKGPVNLTLNE
jgi:cyclophilin family peptidyl-prolyl cis-trans isomerase